MMLSNRSKIALAQLLAMLGDTWLALQFEKHGILREETYWYDLNGIRQILADVEPEPLHSLLDEMARTHGDIRWRFSPKYAFDDRWADLERCLSLDGYRLGKEGLIAVDPSTREDDQPEDDLTRAIAESGIGDATKILSLLARSASAFTQPTPDYNAALTNARVALETLARNIAVYRRIERSDSFNEEKWGEVIAFLRKTGLISKREEEGLTGVYSFVSRGAHEFVGLSEQEAARLGRNFVIGMCYFMVRKLAPGATKG